MLFFSIIFFLIQLLTTVEFNNEFLSRRAQHSAPLGEVQYVLADGMLSPKTDSVFTHKGQELAFS